MAKMWTGRTDGKTNQIADDFNSSISFDQKMYKQDIIGSIAHAQMLCAKNIIEKSDLDIIVKGLDDILSDIELGKLQINPNAEDIHMFVEEQLISRTGEVGKKLHTARSRNDQVALDLKMYLRDQSQTVFSLLKEFLEVLVVKAQENVNSIMPGYTHLQRAQPVTFAQHFLAYAQMFKRDILRLKNAVNVMNYSPLGSCALAGTTYNTDREMVAKKLGFFGATENSLDSVSDRDFCIELLSCFAIIMMHLSRLSEEIVLWTSWEFKFMELSDGFTTGSSIMPQKKNSDMAELVRGKTGRVYGNLMALLTTLKGLPLAYNKDMQEDKECVFDSVETVIKCLNVYIPMLKEGKILTDNAYLSAQKGFINATDLADYLTKKGVPFREAYKMVGQTVALCIKENKTLETLSLEEYKNVSPLIKEDVYQEISLKTCVEKRISQGGTGYSSVKKQIKDITSWLKEQKNLF